jgi:signal transduction histidine kinase
MWAALIDGKAWQGEIINLNKQGEEFIELTWVSPIRKADGTISHYLWVKENITERKKNQMLLSEANKGIVIAEALAKTKAQFLAHMSHELRTPLSHIIGYSDLALLEAMPATSNNYIKIVNRSSKDLLTIINNILDGSKLEVGLMTLNLEPFTLADIRTTLHELLLHAVQLKGLSLTINIEDPVPNRLIGDSLRLRQVLINLLGNSIKFTQQGSVTLNISLKHLDVNEARLLFAVTDTGKGISAEQQAKLFIAFSQVNDSHTKNAEGTGLGLSISQDIVQLMGGLIKVDSHAGLGSCFSFELVLPLALPTIDSPLTPTITPNSEPLSGVRMLVAEDEDFGQKLINGHLKRFGANVVLTNNGLEALAALEQQDFDMVLMDLHMPIMNGYEATTEIRKDVRYAQLPVIAFSASVTDEEKQHCLAVGMNDFVEKPINKVVLLATVERWLKR